MYTVQDYYITIREGHLNNKTGNVISTANKAELLLEHLNYFLILFTKLKQIN